MPSDMTDYLSTREAADRLGVRRGQVLNWIYRRRLVGTRRGWCWYVLLAEVDALKASLRRAS